MRRLNKVRVDLKQIGILPSKLMVESLRANATSFFDENTPLLFDIEVYRPGQGWTEGKKRSAYHELKS